MTRNRKTWLQNNAIPCNKITCNNARFLSPRNLFFSKGFQIFDHGPALGIVQMVAEGMPAVAAAGLGGVVDLAAFLSREVRVGARLQNLDFPAKRGRIVILFTGLRGTCVYFGMGFVIVK